MSDILPVRTFGWMMSAGIVVSLITTFLLFPAGLMLLGKAAPRVETAKRFSFTAALARFTEAHGKLIILLSYLILIINVIGVTRLVVENSFITNRDFCQSTEYLAYRSIRSRFSGHAVPDCESDGCLYG